MYTANEIKKRMASLLGNSASKLEGTFTMDNLQAVAQELARIHNTEIAPIYDAVFLDTASGNNLDRRGLDFNEQRRPAQAAKGRLQFKGVNKTFVPEGFLAQFDGLLFETIEAVKIDSTGLALAAAQCQTLGLVGNVPTGVVDKAVSRVEGVQEVVNPIPFEGGTEIEDDASYRERIFEKIQFPITSGNEHYYEYLAKQVPGIGKAKCKGCWNGPGTVKLVLLSSESTTPDNTIIDNVRQYVEDKRLIGADITYIGAVPLLIHITGRLLLAEGYFIDDINAAVRAEFSTYFEAIAFDGTTDYLSYHKAIEMVFRVPGIQDIQEMKINGNTATISINYEEYCQLEEVNFNAS